MSMLLLAVVSTTLIDPALADETSAADGGPAVAQDAPPPPRGGRRGRHRNPRRADRSAREERPAEKATEDTLAKPYALIQVWGTAYDQDQDVQADSTGYGDPEHDPGFSIKRARLGLTGEQQHFHYELLFGLTAPYDAFDAEDGDIQLLDANLGYARKGFGLELGRAKMPFSRDQMMSSGELTFTERGLGAEHIAPDRALGATVWGGIAGAKATLGVFNAGGDLFGDEAAGKTFVGRVEYQRGGDSYRTWSRDKDLAYGIGAGGFMTDHPALQTTGAGGDLLVRWMGAAVLFDASWARLAAGDTQLDVPGVWTDTTRLALTGELSYALGDFQPAVRYTSFSDDTLGDYSQILGGVTWHHAYAGEGPRAKDHLRVGAGYVHRIEPTARDNDTVRLWAQFRL